MSTSTYLSKKYSLFVKEPAQKPFTVEMVAEELLITPADALLNVRSILGIGKRTMNFFEFEKVILISLED